MITENSVYERENLKIQKFHFNGEYVLTVVNGEDYSIILQKGCLEYLTNKESNLEQKLKIINPELRIRLKEENISLENLMNFLKEFQSKDF